MEKVWLKHYPKGIPAEIDYDISETLVKVFQESCKKFADKPAFTCQGTSISFAELWLKSAAFSSYCQHYLNLKKGDRFAIMSPNLLDYPIALFGALQAGLVVVNLNPLDKAPNLQQELRDSGAKAIMVLDNFTNELEPIIDQTEVHTVILSSVGDLYGFWKRNAIQFYLKFIKRSIHAWHKGHTVRFREVMKVGAKKPYMPVVLDGNDIAFLQFTGGTTGLPKGAVLTHKNMVCNLKQAHAWVKDIFEEGQEVAITALPLYHIFSLLANCLLFIKLGSENVLIPDPRRIASLVKVLAKTPYTTITGVNTLFNALLHNPIFKASDFSRLKLTLGGGMAVQKPVAEEWQKVTGCILTQAYGLTETSPAVCINPVNSKTFNGSIGLPIPSTEVQIRDHSNKALPYGEIGELCVKGPQVMQGYWNNPTETQKALDQDGWLHTADGAYMDEQGYVYIVDRLKDMIIVSGFNVYPAEVEQVIKSMPGVNEVAVIGIPDPLHGETVKACIVKEPGSSLNEQEVIKFCHDKLAAYKTPHSVEFYEFLPKSPVGKILKRELRKQSEQDIVKKRVA
ncbi:MAG: long-chain-fatty-acid--CoA ligase [Gammaproteobacteria bacterium]|nr:long-chain-fatty-acid--CoA ligase [Gammaproteobacteria bacterium]